MGPRVATNGLRSRTLTCVYLQGGRSQVRGRRGMAWGTWEPPVACRAGPWSKRPRQRHPPRHGPGASDVVDVGLQGVNTARSVGWIDQPATYKHVRGLHRAQNITGRSPRHWSLPNAQIWCSGPLFTRNGSMLAGRGRNGLSFKGTDLQDAHQTRRPVGLSGWESAFEKPTTHLAYKKLRAERGTSDQVYDRAEIADHTGSRRSRSFRPTWQIRRHIPREKR